MSDRRVKVVFEAEIAKFKQGMADAASATEKLAQATEKTGKSVDERMQKINAVAAADQKAAKAAGLLYNAQGQLADSNGKVLSSTQAAAHGVEAFSEAVYLSGHEAGVAAAATEAAAKKAAEAAEKQKAAWQTVAPVMMAAGAGMVAGVALAVKKYADFDKAMSAVQAATHETTGNMGLLREAAIVAGADTAFSAEEAAKGIEELAKAGVSTQSILSGGLNGALSLAAAGELAVGDAAEIAATAMTQFKLSGDKIPHLADLLAAGAGKAQGSVADLGAALNQSGLVASATGLTIEETTGTLAAFASNGLLGSDAGTSFKSMLQALQNPSKKASLVMEELGINMYDANGEFAGMTNLAAQLTEGLGDKSQAERDAAMATIFGSDAVRAANVLYSEGAEGIKEWEKQVNSAGYAAQTAAIMQDNLAGDLEKLGGAFDTALIQSGGAANDALRGLVKGAESAVDMFGKIPAPILGTATALAGVTGAALLVGGAFVTAVPKVAETVTAMRDLAAHSPKAAKGLATAGKVAGVAAGAFVLLQSAVALHNATAPEARGVEAFIQDYNRLRSAALNLDDTFANMKFGDGSRLEGHIGNLGDALGRLSPRFGDVRGHLQSFGATALGVENGLPAMRREIEGLSDAMATAVGGGDIEGASKVFREMLESAEAGGRGMADLKPYMDSYFDSLRDVANQYGANISEGELMVWALEGIAPASVAAAQGAESTASALEEVGLAAGGAVESMDKFLESLFAAGLATMSSKDAAFQWADSLRDTKKEIEEVLKTQGKLGPVLEKGGKDFNKSTDSGAAALELFHGKLREGMAVAETYAKDTSKSQEDVQEQLTSTYEAGVKAARGFGMGKEEAEALVRATLEIPKGVSIETWISDQAESGAEAAKEAVDAIPGLKKVTVVVTDEGTVTLTKDQVQSIEDRTIATTVTDEGTILTVQGGINNIEGTTETVLVSDDGTATVVQKQINSVTGKTEYVRVTDGGTVAGVQQQINNIADGYAQIRVTLGGDGANHVSTGRGGRGGLTRASGGSVFGQGTETSDSIPAWLSNNEHVLSAKEVRGLGGHSAVERLRAMARGGDAPAFRSGGPVYQAFATGGPVAPAFAIPPSREVSSYAARPATPSAGPNVTIKVDVHGATDGPAVARQVINEISWKLNDQGLGVNL